jgi:outer membrane protein TolC
MRKPVGLLIFASFAAALQAEVHVITLQDAVDIALKQNPDIAMARLDEQKAVEAVRIARDPFTPRISVGSGLAYSSGFPMSIEGSAPSIVQAQATQFLFNRPQSYAVAQARESARSAGIGTAAKRDEVVLRTALLYLDAERLGRLADLARKQIEAVEKIQETIRGRVQEGRELPIENTRSALNVARARQFAELLDADQAAAETSLAIVLGFSADDRVRPRSVERRLPEVPVSENAAVDAAVRTSKELRRLESALAGKGLEIRSERAARLPRVDLVAQYGLFARYNNYEDFFRKFQRHNGQLGISFQLPLTVGPGVNATAAQTEAEIAHLRLELASTRNRVAQEVRQAYRDIRKAETARQVAKLDLDLAREQLSVSLALMDEGRATLRQVEEARFVENEKWIAFYDAQYAIERASWGLLRQTGELMAVLR